MQHSGPVLSVLALMAGASLALTGCTPETQSAAEENALYQYFAAFDAGEEWTEERFDEQNKVEQEYIAECMVKEGFEYTPDVQNTSMMFTDGEDTEGPEWGTAEFAAEYGYGIVDWPGQTTDESADGSIEYVDPNEDYVMALSESEQIAYYAALYGPDPTEEEWAQMEADESYEWEPENTGCYGEASEAAGDPSTAMYEDPEFTDLWEQLDGLWADVENDDRVVQLNRDWMTCMGDEGYTEFVSPDDAQNQLYMEWDELLTALNPGDDEFAEWKEPTPEETNPFQQREIEVAVADFTCQENIDREAVYTEVNNELSQQFVDSHKATLDAMVAKYGAK